MRMTKRILVVFCVAAMLACACFPAQAENGSPAQDLIERMVVSFAAYGERDVQALEELHDVFSKSDLETIARLARSAQEGDRRAAREIFRRLNQSALGVAERDSTP